MAASVTPRARILDLYGAFGRTVGGWFAIAHLIVLLEPFGIDEQAVRSAASRMKRNGLLVASRRGSVAGYEPSAATIELLTDGDRRIFRDDVSAEPGWVLATFSVPEAQRSMRYQIRSRLAALGFGTIGPGVMIAPRVLADEALHALRRGGLDEHVDVWNAHPATMADERSLVRRAWDIDAIAEAYRVFIADFDERARRAFDDAGDPHTAYIGYVEALSNWRRLPYLDPGLPVSLLPDDWPAPRARAIFHTIARALGEPALRHVLTVTGASAHIAHN